MTNREWILAEVQKIDQRVLVDAFESMYGFDPSKFPIRSLCSFCMARHDGDCPDDMGESCDAAVAEWLDAEVVFR